ncbi:hypothetical protein ccbrp13_15570 [Ktedonobacteria bacterium brp13]|nr:hypothetical protein ccbrp13_15570 [Ktedonobacteria bacterium brp13]
MTVQITFSIAAQGPRSTPCIFSIHTIPPIESSIVIPITSRKLISRFESTFLCCFPLLGISIGNVSVVTILSILLPSTFGVGEAIICGV